MSRLKKIADIEIMAADEDVISKFNNPKAVSQYKVDDSVVARIFVAREPGKNPKSKGREVFYVEYSDGSYDVSRGPGISGFESLEKKVIVRFGDSKGTSRQILQGSSSVSFDPEKSNVWSKYIESKFDDLVEEKIESSNLEEEDRDELLDLINYNKRELLNKTDEEVNQWIDDEIKDLVEEVESEIFEATLEYLKVNEEEVNNFIEEGKQLGHIVDFTKAIEARRVMRSVTAAQISGNRLRRNVKVAASWIDLINLTKDKNTGESFLETQTNLLATYLDDPSGYAFKIDEDGKPQWKDQAGPPNAFIVKLNDSDLYLTIYPDAIQSELTLQDDMSVIDEKFLDTNNIDYYPTFEEAESNMLKDNPTITWRVLPNVPNNEVSNSESWKKWEHQQWEKFYNEHKEEIEQVNNSQKNLEAPEDQNKLDAPNEDLNKLMKIDITLKNNDESKEFLNNFESQDSSNKVTLKN